MADNGTIDTLTPRQHTALLALLSEPSIRQASQASGVPEKTIYNWLRSESFGAAWRAAKRSAVDQAISRAQQESAGAVAELVRLSKSAKSEAVRLGAARAIIEFAVKAVELEDLAARLAALEERYAPNIR